MFDRLTSSTFNILFFAIIVFCFTACPVKKTNNVPPPAPPSAPEKTDFEHTVKYKGETLGIIANWYTGKTSNWVQIQKANNNIKPEKIKIGDRIFIPANLVVKETPLSENFVKSFVTKVTIKEDLQKELNSINANEAPAISVEQPQPTAQAPQEPITQPSPGVLPDNIPLASEPVLNEGAPAENAAPNRETATQSAPAVTETSPATTVPEVKGTPEDAERERLLDELLSQ